MQFDFSAFEIMQAAIHGQIPLEQALSHPAYQAVLAHARRFSGGITQDDVAAALRGVETSFYGMKGLDEKLGRIHQLADILREKQQVWMACAVREFARLLPDEDMGPVRIYPILGYDKGIGLNEAVCMNLNCQAYLDRPQEFLYYLIHETAHVLYERHQRVPALAEVQTPLDWAAYFSLWTQNEGFAVYSALGIRRQTDGLNEPDYQVLFNPARLRSTLEAFQATRARFEERINRPVDEFLESAFGDQRLTYRAGCQIFKEIEQAGGLPAVRRAWTAEPASFLTLYGHFASPL